MNESKTLKATRRTSLGTKHTRKLRKNDRIPGIIYGHGEPPVAFNVDRHELELEILHGHRLLTLDLEGKENSYLIKHVQYNHLGNEYLHIDLARVNLHERIKVQVAIELRGTPKGASDGGVLDQIITDLEVECLASNIPSGIKANVAALEVNESLTVGDLELPDGVTATADAGDTVATVRVIAEVASPEETTEETEPASPEVITKGKAPEEEESKEG